jgi:hypothetical protein
MSRRTLLLLGALVATSALAGGFALQRWRLSTAGPGEGALDLLRAERTALRSRLATLAGQDPRVAAAPPGDIKIGVPESLVTRLVREVLAGFLDQVSVTLKDLHVDTDGEVKVKTFLGTVKAGQWKLGVDIHRVHGMLQPGNAQIAFVGRRVTIALPITLAGGEGKASASFAWDSSGVANAVCRDFEVTQDISGRVAPRTYQVKGAFLLSSRGDGLVATPEFGDIVAHLEVEPSAETWAGVRRTLADQDSFWKCGVALKPEQIEAKLKEVLVRGFDVKLPRKLFREIPLPASLAQSLPPVDGRTYLLQVSPSELAATPGLLWYAADVSLAEQKPAPPAASPLAPKAKPPAK